MYQNYTGGTNDNFMMNPSQNFQPANQPSNPNMYNSSMMGYPGMMKQGGSGMQKTNEPIGFGPSQMGSLKNLSLTQNTSDGLNSQSMSTAKKLSYNSGVFIPKITPQSTESSFNNPSISIVQPHLQNPMISQGMPIMQPTMGAYPYPQTGGTPFAYPQTSGGGINQSTSLGVPKYPPNLLISNSPLPQNSSSQMGFSMQTNAYIPTSPSPILSGMGQPENFNQQMYFNKGVNSSFATGTTQSFSSSGLSSMDTSFSSGIDYNNLEIEKEIEKIVEQIANLRYTEKREDALQELSKKRDTFPSLAKLLWYSVGTVAILLQEIVVVYPYISPPNLSQTVSNKVCNVLGLLQCLAMHPDTRGHFINAHIPLFLYPFLNTSSKSKPFENLRVTSLGVIGALVKGDDTEAITFLVQTEIIPLCLRIMKRGLELSRTVATFIVQKILLDQSGLSYICQTVDRFYAVLTVLNQMIEDLVNCNKEDQRLLRHIIRCYLRLSDNQKANDALRKVLPNILKDPDQTLIIDEAVKKWHMQLLINLGLIKIDFNPGFP